MEYLIGFLISLVVMYGFFKAQQAYNIIYEHPIKVIRYSQSHVHSLISPLLPKPEKIKKIKKTQSVFHNENSHIRVIIMDDMAYWIKDNTFYTANMSMDGTVDKDTTRTVDTMGMNKVQLDKMIFIIDRLREGNLNDSGSTGN